MTWSTLIPFLNSLPAGMDHNELTRMLTDHLSEYPEVKSVKVVRDSKGGVCAFMQCGVGFQASFSGYLRLMAILPLQDAATAGRLLGVLQNIPQRPFLGRFLRFEQARAFRTLLISYRYVVLSRGGYMPAYNLLIASASAPRAPAYLNSGMEASFDGRSLSPSGAGQLHTAMRLYKPRNGKLVSLQLLGVICPCMTNFQQDTAQLSTTRMHMTSKQNILSTRL
jgi:hypothetical protein